MFCKIFKNCFSFYTGSFNPLIPATKQLSVIKRSKCSNLHLLRCSIYLAMPSNLDKRTDEIAIVQSKAKQYVISSNCLERCSIQQDNLYEIAVALLTAQCGFELLWFRLGSCSILVIAFQNSLSCF